MVKIFGAQWLSMKEDKHQMNEDLMEKEFNVFLLDFIADITSNINQISQNISISSMKNMH